MTELICIVCPRGCRLQVDEEHDCAVSGNACDRGKQYGRTELMNPTRVLTSVVPTADGNIACCSVKTSSPVPRGEIPAVMDHLRGVCARAPVRIGEIIVRDVCGEGVHWIATKNIERAD